MASHSRTLCRTLWWCFTLHKNLVWTQQQWCNLCITLIRNAVVHTDKKEKFPHILYKEIQKGSVAKSYYHIWLTALSYMAKYLRISAYIRKPFLIYDFASDPIWISYIWGKFGFLFYQCTLQLKEVETRSFRASTLLSLWAILCVLRHLHIPRQATGSIVNSSSADSDSARTKSPRNS